MQYPARLEQVLGTDKPPIAIGFLDAPPAGVARWQGAPVPAGCAFWQKAMSGQVFYTVQADHYNCAIGCYTHKIDLPPERAPELSATIGFMVEHNYVAMAEVPGIPTLTKTPGVVAYGPLDKVSFEADIVLVALKPAQAMLLYEAALKAGAGAALTHSLGRPACAVLPLTTSSGQTSISLGCKGNRTFTGLPDEHLYVAIPGDKWAAVLDRLAETDDANAAMASYYTEKKKQFASA